MKDILLIILFLAGIAAFFFGFLYLIVMLLIYKSTFYYKKISKEFGLNLADKNSGFSGVYGTFKNCDIKIFNDNIRNGNKKYQIVTISVNNHKHNLLKCSIKSLKKPISNNLKLELPKFSEYFEVNLPKNYYLNENLKLELLQIVSEFGLGDNLNISQNDKGDFIESQSFDLTTNYRYKNCVKRINLLISLNIYLSEFRNNMGKSAD